MARPQLRHLCNYRTETPTTSLLTLLAPPPSKTATRYLTVTACYCTFAVRNKGTIYNVCYLVTCSSRVFRIAGGREQRQVKLLQYNFSAQTHGQSSHSGKHTGSFRCFRLVGTYLSQPRLTPFGLNLKSVNDTHASTHTQVQHNTHRPNAHM